MPKTQNSWATFQLLLDILQKFISSPLILFALLSTAPFCWWAGGGSYSFIGSADYLSPVNIFSSFRDSSYAVNHLSAAGIDQSFLLATIPLNLFYFVLNQFGATSLFATIGLLGIIIFVAQWSFYTSLRYFAVKLTPAIDNSAICILGAILYGFSPYVIAMTIPGHFLTLIAYAVFPLIIRNLDSLLVEDALDWRAATVLFLVFAFCAPGFANIGIIYVLLIACSLYLFSVMLLERVPIYRSIGRFTLFAVLLFLANIWWLAPHLSNISHYVALSKNTATSMVQLVAYASQKASIANFFQGRPEGMMYMFDVMGSHYYVNAIISAIFLLTSLLLVIAAFEKQRQVWVLLVAALASILFAKGVQPPFSGLFLWAYDHVPGFQIFRRPVAKFYGFFLFFFLAGATLGLMIFWKKYANVKRRQGTLLVGAVAAAGYLVFIFTQTPSMIPFNISEMYFRANNYLLGDQVRRALIVPGIYGLNPLYRPAMNSYAGQDFINEVFRFPKVAPDSTTNSLNEPYKIQTNSLMQAIRAHTSICDASRALGISHIIVRDDLVKSHFEDSPRSVIGALDKHPEIVSRTVFADGDDAQLVIYKVKAECTTRLLQLKGDYASFEYNFINPAKIILNIEALQGNAELTLLENYSKNWEVFLDDKVATLDGIGQGSSIAGGYSNPGSWKMGIEDLLYAFKRAPFEGAHAVKSQYANSWALDPAAIKQTSVDNSPALGNIGNVRLVLFYRPQAYFYLGTIISLITLAILMLLGAFSNRQKSGKFKEAGGTKC